MAPAVSEAQRRKMAMLKKQGKVEAEVADEFIHTEGPLPERLHPKPKPVKKKVKKKVKAKPKSKPPVRRVSVFRG